MLVPVIPVLHGGAADQVGRVVLTLAKVQAFLDRGQDVLIVLVEDLSQDVLIDVGEELGEEAEGGVGG